MLLLFRSQAHQLALLQRHIIDDLHFEWSAELLVFLLHEHDQSVTAAFG